ncbi:MAG: hypothetical protein PUJ71_07205 [Clostridiales bacterium]|nr:hypothetical protein [Clostridiales bacterium]
MSEERRPKIGVFGCWRGTMLAACLKLAGADIVAVCDRDPKQLEKIKPYISEGAGVYEDFEKFILHDMDACVLANYYCEHQRYAIRLLAKGISVLSECASNCTMAEGVELVRAVEAAEKLGAKYMLIENYPYSAPCQEMRRVYQSGILGRAVHGEGEYIHPMSTAERLRYAPTPEHWRNHIPPTYYNTHSVGPIMYATEAMPLYISAQAVERPEVGVGTYARNDPYAQMTCKMSDGSVFSFCGWGAVGAHGSWYRIVCTEGDVETVRFDGSRIRVGFNSYNTPAGSPRDSVYAPTFPYDGDKAAKCGHSGGDYYVCREFVEVLLGKREPFFDVYRATAMASCGILGWRSCLENGRMYEIPDFRREEDRVKYENDTASPFVKPDGTMDIQCSLEPDKNIRTPENDMK